MDWLPIGHRHRPGDGLQLHQRLPRRGQRDRDLGLDPGPDAAGRARAWPPSPTWSARSSAPRSPRPSATGIIDAPQGNDGPGHLSRAALIGAIGWNLLTWWYGLPSSSSHALIGGLGGAALAAGADGEVGRHPGQGRHPDGRLADRRHRPRLPRHDGDPVALPRRASPGKVSRGFRYAQTVSAAAMAFGHGLQDAAKTAGVVVLALNVGGLPRRATAIPLWVLRPVAPSSSASARMPVGGGSCARSAAGSSTSTRRRASRPRRRRPRSSTSRASAFGAPISTTHTITSAIMGVGATKRLSRRAVGRGRQHRRRLGADLPRRRPRPPPWPTS